MEWSNNQQSNNWIASAERQLIIKNKMKKDWNGIWWNESVVSLLSLTYDLYQIVMSNTVAETALKNSNLLSNLYSLSDDGRWATPQT